MKLEINLTDEQAKQLAVQINANVLPPAKPNRQPTQRDIEALTDALWHAVERMKNLQSYQAGTAYVLPTVDMAIEYGLAALAPFTGKAKP
jgi:hypothetical protein